MEKNVNGYMDTTKATEQLVRVELIFAPILIIIPLVVSLFMIWCWFSLGFSQKDSSYTGELVLGIIILVGNICFDVPFLRSLLLFRKQRK
ncbi:MAG: hypothetical protein NT038_09030 [Euryarchaeota archaeon]|nr:hypothetical protein [Euryarchaeota archaeon]